METGTILIVDDNKSVLTSLELLLETEFSKVRTASNPNQITSLLTTQSIDIVLLDMNFSAGINSGNEGIYWLKQIHEQCPSLPVVMLTAYGDVELAVRALKNGATDFLLKPWDNRTLVQKLKEAFAASQPSAKLCNQSGTKSGTQSSTKERAKERIRETTKEQRVLPELIIGRSPAMLQLMKVVAKVARTDANILITGENGTGKEMLAREIHRLSTRSAQQMLTVDMGALSESLFESELFGHERGAFTDAYESRPGKFEAADGSSLFMDEIGNLPLPLQSKLLTALQNRTVTRIGSNKAVPVDIRLISATNQEIPERVKEGLFREDLFYRINTIHLEIPPLRERGDDILLFIDTFLRRFANKYQRQEVRMHEQTLAKLHEYPWPGNIRELQHTIEKAVILCEGSVIRPKDIFVKQSWKPQTSAPIPNLEEVERQAIEVAIEQNKGNLTATAEQLGVSRQTLYNKLKKFNV